MKQGITVFNAPGTVDCGYKGEIGVILLWSPSAATSQDDGSFANFSGKVCAEIHKGDRIAQFVLAPVTRCVPVEIKEVSQTERGEGGFGSTGK